MPPSPADNGQDSGTGHAAKNAAESGTNAKPMSQRRTRGMPINTVRMAPPIIMARPAAQADQPSICRDKSAKIAPGPPNRFCTSASVAAFQLGSLGM